VIKEREAKLRVKKNLTFDAKRSFAFIFPLRFKNFINNILARSEAFLQAIFFASRQNILS